MRKLWFTIVYHLIAPSALEEQLTTSLLPNALLFLAARHVRL